MSPRHAKVVLVAGIGGDAHSVGLNILRWALVRAGFLVAYLGTQNSVSDIRTAAAEVDVVLLSNMDGHAMHYLRGVEALGGVEHGPIWYIGGNPSTQPEVDLPLLRRLGFRRIFQGYVSPQQVIEHLEEDLGAEASERICYVERPANRWSVQHRRSSLARALPQTFVGQRDAVLDSWSTGDGARDFGTNADRLRRVTLLVDAQRQAQRDGRLLFHPRCGVGTVAGQEKVFATLHRAGADVLSFQIDSLTRNNLYPAVDLALRDEAKAVQAGQGALNGFPAVNHGPDALFHLVTRNQGVPMQVRHSTRDPRLLAEISYAGGVSSFEGGAICYNLPYYKDYDPAESVQAWRYVDLLTAHYQREHGIALDREFFGTLTAALVPPCIAIASCVLEALMAADAGVMSVSLGYAEQGNRAQDIAAILAMKSLASAYLLKIGHTEVEVSTVFHQYMCAFPQDPALARQLLVGSAQTAMLAGATRMMLKTHVEASRIPTADENAECMVLMRDSLQGAKPPGIDAAAIDREFRLICAEAGAILDAALAAGEGDVHRATVEAISRGILDVPFSPSVWNAGQALTMRDASGAVRFVETGAVPLPAEVREIHSRLVDRRIRQQSLDVDELIAEDIVAIVEGRIAGWPLDEAGPEGVASSPVALPEAGARA